jgi:regulator of protease activity HflC (stomatin/prohibitin superfamily)
MISKTSALIAVTLLSLMGCATVGPGQVGLLWTVGSGLQQETYAEGLHSVAPWNRMEVYDLRTHSSDEVLNVISVNGLAINLEATVRYHLVPGEVVALDRQIGPRYYATVLEPVLRSEARRVIGRYTPEEIYSTKRDVIERETREGVEQKIANEHIALEAILIRNVELPPPIRAAIDLKLTAEQEVLKMKYVLEVAKAKAEERRIEAKGIADYNAMIAASLNPAILEYARIQQLEGLAQSTNAKTVVLGPGTTSAQVMLQTHTGAASGQ